MLQTKIRVKNLLYEELNQASAVSNHFIYSHCLVFMYQNIYIFKFVKFKLLFLQFSVDGGWSDWQSWSNWVTKCPKETRSRTRDCDNPAPQNGGHNCTGDQYEYESKHIDNCPSMELLIHY